MSTCMIGTATVTVEHQGPNGDEHGKPCWSYSVVEQDGATVLADTDLFGWGDADEMLRTLCGFLSAEADRYRSVVMGDGRNEDGWITGSFTAAEWCYMNEDELSMASLDPDDLD